jgi:hypothetical protein
LSDDKAKDIVDKQLGKRESMFCVNCGSRITTGNNFCTNCGVESKNTRSRTDSISSTERTGRNNKKTKLSIKKKVGIGIAVFFGVLIILGAIGNSSTSTIDRNNGLRNVQPQPSSIGEKDNPAKVGDTMMVENIAYKVTSTSTTHNVGGTTFSENADGIFIIVNMEIENKDTKPVFTLNNFKLIDSQGREFNTDSGGSVYLDNTVFFEQLQPALPKNIQIIFDVPITTESYVLEIHYNEKKYITLGQYN